MVYIDVKVAVSTTRVVTLAMRLKPVMVPTTGEI